MKKEPIFWIKLIGKAGIIYGLVQLLSLPVLLQKAKIDYLSKWAQYDAPEWCLHAIFYSSFIVLPVLVTLAGVGLVKIKSWGRTLGIFTSLYFITMNLFNTSLFLRFIYPQITDQPKNTILFSHIFQGIPGLIMYAFLLYFLIRKSTGELFNKI